jgi:hypothetical protein
MNKEDGYISEDVKELVVARLGIMPSNYKLSIGGQGTFTRDELIQEVKKSSLIGNQIVKMEFNFIKALTSGKIIETINQNE